MSETTTRTDDGGPAFPHASWPGVPGMTLRDYFAGQALIAFLANEHNRQRSLEDARQNGRMLFDELASASYAMSAAMIAARAAADPTGEE